jgi:glycerol kinase
MSSILALDQGTTSSRALVIHQDGRVLAQAQHEFPQHFPQPGWVEHDPEELFQTTVRAGREALSACGERPVAIGITNQRETVVLWNRRTLEPVGPAIVWQDRRTASRCAELRERGLDAMIRRQTGLVVDPYFSATKLEWLLASDADLRRSASRGELAFGTVDSWLVARLTGGASHVTDPTNASRTMLWSLQTKNWHPDLLATFSVPPELLPRVMASSSIAGETDPAVFGYSLPIGGIAGDQQAALYGQGCIAPGMAKNTYGTGAFLLLYAGLDVPSPPDGILATAVCDPRGGLAYGLEGSVFIAGAVIQWLRDGLGLLPTAAESERLAASVSDSGGVYFVPAFVGLGSPHWEAEARGMITGLTRGTTRAHLVRAALESMAFSTEDLVDGMLGATSLRLPELRVDGGATANAWLMQFQADLLGVPVERPDCVETTALGAAALAGLSTGVWHDLGDFLATRRYVQFRPKVDQATRELWRRGWRRAISAALHWARES